MIPKINSSHGAETRNIINRVIEVLNQQGKSLQDLVAEGQLTEEQYANLLITINGMLKSGDVDRSDLNPTLGAEVDKIKVKLNRGDVSVHDINKNKGKIDQTYLTQDLIDAITGSAGANVLSEVADRSVTTQKIADKSVSPEKTNFIKVSSNLLDISASQKNKDITSDGTVIDYEFRNLSDYISVIPGQKVTFRYSVSYARYDENFNFLSFGAASDDGTGTTKQLNNFTYYIRVVYTSRYENEAQVNSGDTLLDYEPHYKKLEENISVKTKIKDGAVSPQKTDFIKVSNNLFNINDIIMNKTIRVNGDIESSDNFFMSHKIPVASYKKIYTIGVYYIVQYDTEDNFISRITVNNIPGEANDLSENVSYIRVTANEVGNPYYTNRTMQVNIGDSPMPFEKYGMVLSEEIEVPGASNDDGNQKDADLTVTDHFVIDGVVDRYYRQTPLPGRDSGKLAQAVNEYFDVYASSHPDYVNKEQVAISNGGQPIYRYDFNPNVVNDKSVETKFPKIFIICGAHGTERVPAEVTNHFFDQLCNNWEDDELLETLRWNVHFVIIPMLNPDGWDNDTRQNANGVDLNRQYPTGWVQGVEGTSTYGGEAPLTEPESIAVNEILENENDIIYVCDFHNFSSNGGNFIWIPASSLFINNMAKSLISKLNRNWLSEYPWIETGEDNMIGYTSGGAVGGTLGSHALSLGIYGSTFETGMYVSGDPEETSYSANVITLGTEAFTNWMLLILRNNIRL